MAQRYPSFNEYQAALQNPAVHFHHPLLRGCSPELDLWGIPRVRSGGFALTYRMTSGEGHVLAVRCFHKPVEDRARRYAAIHNYLKKNSPQYFLPVHYVTEGISLGKNSYPVTYMDWVDGETLEAWLYANVHDGSLLRELTGSLTALAESLEAQGIAHGDLSHRNILVADRSLMLVDYDGMYVPELDGQSSAELGNIHFQHPARSNSDFNPRLDRFSQIVLYLSLTALALRPQLWKKYQSGGEGLLFCRSDFIDPFNSPLIQELETMADLRGHVQLFRMICSAPFEVVPSLRDFIDLKPGAISTAGYALHTDASQNITYLAIERLTILRNLGRHATVIGRVNGIHEGKTPDGHSHLYINLGSWKARGFTIILWDKALEHLEQMEMKPADYIGEWVAVTGILTAFNHRPQIAVDLPIEIEVLSSEADAEKRYESGRGKHGRPWPKPFPETDPFPAPLPAKEHVETPVPAILKPGKLDVSVDILKKLANMYPPAPEHQEGLETGDNAAGADPSDLSKL